MAYTREDLVPDTMTDYPPKNASYWKRRAKKAEAEVERLQALKADLHALLDRTVEALDRFADMGINDEDLYTDIIVTLGHEEAE